MLEVFDSSLRQCIKCNYKGELSDSSHKEYCRYFQYAVNRLEYFPRNKLERDIDYKEAVQCFENEESFIEKAIHFSTIISCEYDDLVHQAIEKRVWQGLPSIKAFASDYLRKQEANLHNDAIVQIKHRIERDF